MAPLSHVPAIPPPRPGGEAPQPGAVPKDSREPRLARRLLDGGRVLSRLGLAMMLLASTSCLITDPIEGRTPPPPATNHPPRIPKAAVEPLNWSRIVVPNDCKVTLSVGYVEDDDLNDTLSVRWFVDWDPSPGALNTYVGGTIDPSGSVERINTGVTTYPLTIKSPGVHVVTMVLSDGFSSLPTDSATPQAGRDVTSVSWTIDASAATDCIK